MSEAARDLTIVTDRGVERPATQNTREVVSELRKAEKALTDAVMYMLSRGDPNGTLDEADEFLLLSMGFAHMKVEAMRGDIETFGEVVDSEEWAAKQEGGDA